MILIQSENLENICDSYIREILSDIKIRKEVFSEFIRLNEGTLIITARNIKGKFHLMNEVYSIVSGNKPRGNTNELTDEMESLRGSLNVNQLIRKNRFIDLNDYLSESKIKEILVSEPTDLKRINQEILDKFKDEFKANDPIWGYFFKYDNAKNKKSISSAIGALNVSVCPYCNRNYIGYILDSKKEKVIGPTIDHFFSQKDHPILALSFYNLIPACTPCNSNLKGDIEFGFDTHIHPYFNSFEDNVKFIFEIDSTKDSRDQFEIKYEPYLVENENIDREDRTRIYGDGIKDSGSKNVFKTEEIYRTHHGHVKWIHSRFDANNGTYLDSVKDLIANLESSESAFYEFHFANFYRAQDFNNKPLAMLTRDIYIQLKEFYVKNGKLKLNFES